MTLTRQEIREASTRLRAGRERTAGKSGSLGQIVAGYANEIFSNPKKADTTNPEGPKASGSSIETLPFGLTPEEKQSLETEITAKRPIGDTPAYRKFLGAIFPNKATFPYLADYSDALKVVSKLSELFGKKVRLPEEAEAIKSLADNDHLTWYRSEGSVGVESAGVVGYVWLSGLSQGESAPCAWRDHDGYAGSSMGNRRSGHSVIPVFG